MDNLIEFLSKYWGYTIIGTVSVGTVVANVWAIIKMYIQLKRKTVEHSRTVQKYEDLQDKYNVQLQRNQYMDNVIATTFKAISYITMASKLSTDDKLALQEDFSKLLNTTKAKISPVVKAVTETVTETVVDIVEDTITQTDGLLTKYLGDK